MRKLLLFLLLLAGCKSSTVSGKLPIEPALLSLVPGDTVALAGARLDILKKTPTWQKHFAGRKSSMLDEMAAKTGINLRKDVWQILAASNGKQNVVMVRGKFSEMGMEPEIKVEGAKRMPYKGLMLIGTEEAAVAFINPTTAVLGKASAVRYILDQRNKAALSPQLKALLDTVPAGSQIWFAGLGGLNIGMLGIPPEGNLSILNKIYSSLRQLTLSADMSSGVRLQGKGIATSEEEARRLATALKGLTGLGRLNTPDNQPELLRIWDAVQIEQKERAVTLDASIPGDLVDKLVGMLPAMPR
jgi:hypothetical protein